MKPALRGVPACMLGALLSMASLALAQEGPYFPGLEPADSAPLVPDDVPTPEPASAEPLPVDDSITPLDEHGRPMTGPEPEQPLRLPAPPPVPELPRVPAGGPVDSAGPALPIGAPPARGERVEEPSSPQPSKRNLWQRSTDALRELAPKPKADEAVNQDAARQWQLLRQRELQLQRQQQEQQRAIQQRQMRERELQRHQFQQQQLLQRKTPPPQNWDPRLKSRELGPPAGQRPAAAPGVEARTTSPPPAPATSRRQPQRFGSPQPGYRPGVQAAPSARQRPAGQPREAKNEPRSPWERS